MQQINKHGGRRVGAGRKKTHNVSVNVRLNPFLHRIFQLAGSALIAQSLEHYLNSDNWFSINPQLLTLEERDCFLQGIREAAGNNFKEDLWWRPWTMTSMISVKGKDPLQWGCSYWQSTHEALEDVDADYAHIAAMSKMEEVLREKLNAFTRSELLRGVSTEALIQVDTFYFYTQISYNRDALPKDPTDSDLQEFLKELVQTATIAMISVRNHDLAEAKKSFEKIFPPNA